MQHLTWVFDLVKGIHKDFKRTTKLLGSKGRMQGKEDLDHLYGTVGIFFECTHVSQLVFLFLKIEF